AARDPLFFPELAEAGLAPWRPKRLVFGAPAEPDQASDISANIDRKIEALAHHRSHVIGGALVESLDTQRLAELWERVRSEHLDPGSGRYVERLRMLEL